MATSKACASDSTRMTAGQLAFAFVEPFFFIGYLISIALFGLYQAIFMANAGGAWDNAKKIVETELKMKGTPLHAATALSVSGDTARSGQRSCRWVLAPPCGTALSAR